MATKVEQIVAGLGGLDNIEEINGDDISIHAEVINTGLVNETILKAAGAYGVARIGGLFPIVFMVVGADANPIIADIQDML